MSDSDVSSIASLPHRLPPYTCLPPAQPYEESVSSIATSEYLSPDVDLYEASIYARQRPVVDHEDQWPNLTEECHLLGEMCLAAWDEICGFFRRLF